MLELWAAATIAHLHKPGGTLAIHWSDGLKWQGFVGTYATELFSVQGCEFVNVAPCGAIAVSKDFSRTELNERGIIRLPSGTRQIVLRSGMHWGTSCPDRLHRDLQFYELDPGIGLKDVVDTYRAIAIGTEPTPHVTEGIPNEVGERVGVHIRLQNKLVDSELPWNMCGATWRLIEEQAIL